MEKKWWHSSVVYQIYPRSFMDSNNDGIGDLVGIISKLDYLQKLGIDVIWLSPVYDSPNDDNGYDISDYYQIMSDFGTMEDMEKLIEEANIRGIKIVMDLIFNHTSDEHAWFVESRKSKDNQYRNYYIWRDGVDGEEPSDLQSVFSGSAWQLDEVTGQYYLHLFSKKQPDLNTHNKDVRFAMYEMMKFWLNKGIGGFRMDVIELIGKEIDNGILANGPKLHDYLQEMNIEVLSHYDVMTVGETNNVTPEIGVLYTNPNRNELNMVFTFEHISLDEVVGKSKWDLKELQLPELKKVFNRWQTELHGVGWNSLFWNNHDQPRIVSRWGNDSKYRVESAKMLATVLHFMQGTPYIYQGEEIGMTNIKFDKLEDYRDIETFNMYEEKLSQGWLHEQMMHSIYVKGRDNARTPMQWNNQLNGGFMTDEPWLKVNDNYKEVNVEAALKDNQSIFYHYQKLISLRRELDIITYGTFGLLFPEDENIFAYTRTLEEEKLIIVANFYEEPQRLVIDENNDVEILISNYPDSSVDMKKLYLRPYEAICYSVL